MKKIILFWNGMASQQVSGGDIYVQKIVTNVSQPLEVVLSGSAREVLGDDLSSQTSIHSLDTKLAHNLASLLWLYTTRLVKASLYAFRRRKQYDTSVATSPFMYDIIPAILSGSKKNIVILFHILPKRTSTGIVTRIRFGLASLEQKLSLVLIGRFFDTIFVGNDELKEFMSKKFPKKNIYVAHAGIDTAKIDQSPDVEKDDNLALFVGRLTHQKGIFDLIDTAKFLENKHPELKIVLVGDGPDKVRFSEAVKRRSANSIQMVGFVSEDEKYALLKKAKYFIFPSYEEGWGIALAEALYADCIAVCYEIEHYESLFSDYPYYVPVGDVDGLKRTVSEVYGKSVRSGQKKFISQYDNETVIESVVEKITL